MGFEKKILQIADESGVEGAYFYEGTLFFSPDNTTHAEFSMFCEKARRYGNVEWRNEGDLVAVDFHHRS